MLPHLTPDTLWQSIMAGKSYINAGRESPEKNRSFHGGFSTEPRLMTPEGLGTYCGLGVSGELGNMSI